MWSKIILKDYRTKRRIFLDSANTSSPTFDAEIAVIGCLLWDNRTYEKIADFLD